MNFREDIYKIFFKESQEMFAIVGFDGYFKDVSQGWTQTLGWSREELLRKPFIELVHPEDQEVTLRFYEKLVSGMTFSSFDNRYLCKDQSYRWLRWRGSFNVEEEYAITTAVDITNEQQAITEVQHQSQIISEIFNQAPCLSAVAEGPEFVFTFANKMYLNLVGGRNIIGLPLKEAIPDLDPQVYQILQNVYKTGQMFQAENLKMFGDWNADGKLTEKYFTLVYAPLRNSKDQVVGLWTFAFDTTESKKNENLIQVAERVAALGRMAAGVAHEINNPLAYILGSLNLISGKLKELSTGKDRETVTEILKLNSSAEEGILRVRDIVRSLKKLSSDYKSEGTEALNLKEIIEAALNYANTEIKHRARVFLQVEDGIYIRGNRGELIQVFLNLIINAGHAIQKGTVKENLISITTQKDSGHQIKISIKDTGCGIARENIAKIFDPFYTSKNSSEGTGLGLSIVHRIVQSMGGCITVQSEVNQGTEFILNFPVIESQNTSPIQSLKKPKEEAQEMSRSLDILIIDDEEEVGEVLSLALSMDHQVEVFQRAEEALQLLEKGKTYDVILCDLMMAEMNGMEFYQRLEMANNPNIHQIVFMTGGAFTDEGRKFLSQVENEKIEKPFNIKELNKVLSRVSQGSLPLSKN